MWLAVAFLFTPTTLRRMLCSVAQGPLNVLLIFTLRESLALNQSVWSLNLSQICLLVSLRCQIEFSWTATLPWHVTQSLPQRSLSVFSPIMSWKANYRSPWTWMREVVSTALNHKSGWLDCCCCSVGQGMLNQCCLHETSQHNPLMSEIHPVGTFLLKMVLLKYSHPVIINYV